MSTWRERFSKKFGHPMSASEEQRYLDWFTQELKAAVEGVKLEDIYGGGSNALTERGEGKVEGYHLAIADLERAKAEKLRELGIV